MLLDDDDRIVYGWDFSVTQQQQQQQQDKGILGVRMLNEPLTMSAVPLLSLDGIPKQLYLYEEVERVFLP